MERRLVRVDSLPNKTWSKDKLIELGLMNGVDFAGTPVQEIRSLSVTEILQILYEQVEFEEWQDPVARSESRKSAIVPEVDNLLPARSKEVRTVAKVTYIGNGILNFLIEGKPYVFMPYMVYTFPIEKRELVEVLLQRPDFKGSWDTNAPVDSLTETVRRWHRDAETMLYDEEEPEAEDYFGLRLN